MAQRLRRSPSAYLSMGSIGAAPHIIRLGESDGRIPANQQIRNGVLIVHASEIRELLYDLPMHEDVPEHIAG